MAIPSEAESLIAGAPVSAHLATAVEDRPHVAPVWYGYRDGTLYFMTGGKKLSNLRRNPRVSLSIEDARGGDVAWNVTLLGRATVVDDSERMDWANGWIYDKYEDGEEADAEEDENGTHTDGGEEDRGEEVDGDGDDVDVDGEYALVEVSIGSASWNVYG